MEYDLFALGEDMQGVLAVFGSSCSTFIRQYNYHAKLGLRNI